MGVGGHARAKTRRGGEGVEEVREGVEVGVDRVEAHAAVEVEGGGGAGRRSEEGVPGEGRQSWVGEVEGWVDVGDELRRSLHGTTYTVMVVDSLYWLNFIKKNNNKNIFLW